MSELKPVDAEQIRNVLARNDTARLRMWLKVCASCGICADSCFLYLTNDKKPEYMPQYKVRATLGELIKKKGEVTREFLEEAKEIVWGKCNMCRRCSQYCPFGIDMAVMIHVARQCLRSQDVCPERLMNIDQSYIATGNQMEMTEDDFRETCEWMAEEGQETIKDLEVPVDKENCRIMYTVNAREPKYYPQDIQQVAQIFAVAGESWTMPAFGWDATNLAMFSGNMQVAGMLAQNMYDAAKRLNAEMICITECGHAYRAAKYEGPYWTKQPGGKAPVPVTHAVAVFHEYVKSGKIKLKHKFEGAITYQHPCNLSRNGDLAVKGPELLEMIASDVRHMQPSAEYGHCCGGGGGFIPMGPDYKARRMVSGRIKAEQIRATGAKYVLVPCHNCTDQINDLNKEYDLGIKVLSFKEVLCEIMEIPPHLQPEESEEEE